ncbi:MULTISPECIES: hypothetical protein [unclassified Luteimonas]|uniref:hypothetical protein n=1 Tax=Luteimonas sp. YGD11-2 TaxID=2508168 RepID=UPI001E43D02A|nr:MULTISPECIES: hypothetical protein [unclassified Luteimonas]
MPQPLELRLELSHETSQLFGPGDGDVPRVASISRVPPKGRNFVLYKLSLAVELDTRLIKRLSIGRKRGLGRKIRVSEGN